MNECLNIAGRTIIMVIIIFFLTKLLGKKQISQLSLFDYIVGITIGSTVADISLDIQKNFFGGIVSLVIFVMIAYFISLTTMKSIKARRFLTGVPTMLVEKGKIIESGLRKSKIDVNELLAEARIEGYFDIEEIDYAFMEINGAISFLPKEKHKPVTKKDMNIKNNNVGLTANVIIDGMYMKNNMKSIDKDKKWLDHELKMQGYEEYSDILLATVDTNYKVNIYKKNVKPNRNTILE